MTSAFNKATEPLRESEALRTAICLPSESRSPESEPPAIKPIGLAQGMARPALDMRAAHELDAARRHLVYKNEGEAGKLELLESSKGWSGQGAHAGEGRNLLLAVDCMQPPAIVEGDLLARRNVLVGNEGHHRRPLMLPGWP